MKASIPLCYTGQDVTGNPEEHDGFLRLADREIPYIRGNSKKFPAPVVPAAVAVELCQRNGGTEWKCVEPSDQKEVDAAIAAGKAAKEAKAKAPAETVEPAPAKQ